MSRVRSTDAFGQRLRDGVQEAGFICGEVTAVPEQADGSPRGAAGYERGPQLSLQAEWPDELTIAAAALGHTARGFAQDAAVGAGARQGGELAVVLLQILDLGRDRRTVPWNKYKTFIDVGTAEGNLPVQVALRHPHLTGGGTELPNLRPIFEEYVASFGLQDRLRFYENDFMREPLPEADVLVMGHILHDWGLPDKRMLISKAFAALPPGGALIVYDAVIDDERRRNAFGLLMSLNMLIEMEAGFAYTGAECCGWLRDAGFRETYVEHLAGPESMVVGIK